MADSFDNLDTILRDWAKDKVAEKSCRGIEQVREAERRKIKPFLEHNSEKYSSCLSRQSSETKPGTKFVLVSQEPFSFISNLTSPINKMFMRLIYLKNSTFHSLTIIVDTLIDVRNET